MKRILLIIPVLLCLAGCSKEDYSSIVGGWGLTRVRISFKDEDESWVTFDRDDSRYTFTFKDNGQFIMNGSEGAKVGKWSAKKQRLILNIDNKDYKWNIGELSDKELVLYHYLEEYDPFAPGNWYPLDDDSDSGDWVEYYRETYYFVRNKHLTL